jgi:hypothetical protein
VDPKEGEDEGHDGQSPGAEEARAWKESGPEVLLRPKYGVEGEDFENVWGGDGPSGAPKENP